MRKDETAMAEKKLAGVGSLQKSLTVLDCFLGEKTELTLSEVAALSGVSMPTALRMLSALCAEGFLMRDRNKVYTVGWKLYRLGKRYRMDEAVHQILRPLMEELRDMTGETVNLYVRQGLRRVCIDQAKSRSELCRTANPNVFYPLWGGATAKVFLAHMEQDEADEVKKTAPAERQAEWDRYMESVAQVRVLGYAMSHAEREAGISSVACPLYNCDGSFAAVMCISGPDFRFTEAAKQKWLPELVSRCRRASLCLTLRSFG